MTSARGCVSAPGPTGSRGNCAHARRAMSRPAPPPGPAPRRATAPPLRRDIAEEGRDVRACAARHGGVFARLPGCDFVATLAGCKKNCACRRASRLACVFPRRAVSLLLSPTCDACGCVVRRVRRCCACSCSGGLLLTSTTKQRRRRMSARPVRRTASTAARARQQTLLPSTTGSRSSARGRTAPCTALCSAAQAAPSPSRSSRRTS